MAMANPNRIYEDFVPASDLISEEGCDTVLLHLPGFKKEQLRVQLTTSRILKISGERPIDDKKWKRFHKEIRVPSNCDIKGITAKFEGGILYIRQPKLITPPATEQDKGKAVVEVPKPQPPPQQPPPPPPQQPPSPPQPQPEKKDAPPRGMEEEEKDETATKDGEKKEKCELVQRPKVVVGGGSRFLKGLRRPENLKRLVVSVLVVLILGFYISYMFNSFTRNDWQQSVLEYDEELLP